KFASLFTNVFQVALLTNRVDSLLAQLAPALTNLDKNAATELRNQGNAVKDRIVQRAEEIRKQLAFPESKPIVFVNNVAKPLEWRTETQPNVAKLERAKDEARTVLHIVAATNSAASWRCKLLIEGGR